VQIDVNGDNTHPVYKLLKSQPPLDYPIKWNWSKFLVSARDLVVSRRFACARARVHLLLQQQHQVDKNGSVLKRFEPLYEVTSIADDIIPILP
jgi:glutathione peroxidase-family protein